eukprot:m.513972 g.513972  ORF g.513972 m.513972 type:complete len:755 (+) comp21911_c1_seq3:85-2349(+)
MFLLRAIVCVSALLTLVCAQQISPAISAVGNTVTITVPTGGQVTLTVGSSDPVTIATSDDVNSATSLLMDEILALKNNFTIVQQQNSQLLQFQTDVLACAAIGQLYDATTSACVYPRPSVAAYATAQRMTNAEADIDQIEQALNGTNGTHLYCNLCPRNQYVSTACNHQNNTVCSPCPAGQYSLGGFAESCMSCADEVPNCGFATCTSTADVSCQYCSTEVTLGNAYILTGPNNCTTTCPAYTYRNSTTSCASCSKAGTCAAAQCQANSGSVIVTGKPSISTFYQLGVLRPVEPLLAAYSDGVSTGTAIHSANELDSEKINPWFQVDVGQNVQVSFDRLVYWNRNGPAGCRAFEQDAGSGCTVTVLRDTDRVWNGTNQGTKFGISDTPVSSLVSTSLPTQMCTARGQRNCLCAYLTTYNPSSNRYDFNCNGATGRYVYVILPGTNRVLNFAELSIYGTYAPTSPTLSTCVAPCVVSGCQPGQQTCPATPMTPGTCAASGCSRTVVAGSGGYGYVPSTQQCSVCTASQYLNANGRCTGCPARCASGPCQADSIVTGGTATQSSSYSPTQYAATVARTPGNVNGFTHTVGGGQANPWWQLQLDASESVSSVVVALRRGPCGARSFQSNRACNFNPANVPAGVNNQFDRDFNASDEGAIVRVATAPCVAGEICPGTICGLIFRPQTGGTTVASYTITCPSPIQGTYVSVQLPGASRVLSLSQVLGAAWSISERVLTVKESYSIEGRSKRGRKITLTR